MREFVSGPKVGSPQWIYHLLDGSGTVLYIGRTQDPSTRVRVHSGSKDWWPEVATVKWLPLGFVSVSEAAASEAEQIDSLRPLYNVIRPNGRSLVRNFGNRQQLTNLRRLRGKSRMSQADLARVSGLTQATISSLETGRRGANYLTVVKIAEALNVEPEELTSREQ